MLKSTKRFILSNSGLNSQGFRMLTEGAILDDFEKNPVLLWNHQRPEGNDRNQILPLGYWTDIEINGDEISAVPVFDDKDEFALSIYNKVEQNILRMCSAGALPLETSDEETLLLPGQQRATVTKWVMKEGSICDIGANPGSLAVALYDEQENIITLSEANLESVIPQIKKEMIKKPFKKTTTPPAKPAGKNVNLADPNKPEETEELNDPEETEELADPETEEEKDALIQKLQEEIEGLKAQLSQATEQLADEAEQKEAAKVENLVSKAVSQRRITLAQKPHFIKLASADLTGTVALLNTMKPAPSIKLALNTHEPSQDAARLETLSNKSFDELFNSGDLDFVKLNAPDTYKSIFKTKFGKEPKI